jgi:RNA polymerase primary sigma factor
LNYHKDDNKYSEMDTISHLCARAAKFKILTPEEERELLIKTKSDDPKVVKKAFEDLVDRNLRLVIKKAKEFTGRGLPLEDLVQEGVTGLIRAIEKFDLSLENKLSTYATRWIEQRVRRALENKSRMVKIPLNRLAQITQLKKAYRKYIEDENRNPTPEEIAEILSTPEKRMTKEEALELGRYYNQHVSLDETTGEDDNLSMLNYIVDEKTPPEERVEHFTDKVYAENLLSFLTEADSKFIKLKYGFLDNKERTNREMAQLLGCSSKEIKDREQKIILRLQEISNYEDVNYEV